MTRKTRKCPHCGSNKVIKRGIQDEVQIYKCKGCGKRFRNARRNNHEDIWNAYVFHKQTVRELIEETEHNKKTILKYLRNYPVKEKNDHRPRKVNLVVDATYFGKRKESGSWGVILFRDAVAKENLWWKYIDHERASDYLEGKVYLESLGYSFHSVTAD
jgi:transcription elongation factor Elf1